MATVTLLALATLLPDVVASLMTSTVPGGLAPAPGATAAAVAPEREAEMSIEGDVALDDEPEASRRG